jgi:hypothetical protein
MLENSIGTEEDALVSREENYSIVSANLARMPYSLFSWNKVGCKKELFNSLAYCCIRQI